MPSLRFHTDMKVATIADKKFKNPRCGLRSCNVRKLRTPLTHKESILLFIFTFYKLVMSFNISKIHLLTDNIGQFIAPNRGAIDHSRVKGP